MSVHIATLDPFLFPQAFLHVFHYLSEGGIQGFLLFAGKGFTTEAQLPGIGSLIPGVYIMFYSFFVFLHHIRARLESVEGNSSRGKGGGEGFFPPSRATSLVFLLTFY